MSKRLAGYDYSQPGFYFVTICTQEHRLVFGSIVDDRMNLRSPGQIAQSVLVTLPRRFAHVKLDEYVFMPNHMHAIFEYLKQQPHTKFVVLKEIRGLHGKMTITIP